MACCCSSIYWILRVKSLLLAVEGAGGHFLPDLQELIRRALASSLRVSSLRLLHSNFNILTCLFLVKPWALSQTCPSRHTLEMKPVLFSYHFAGTGGSMTRTRKHLGWLKSQGRGSWCSNKSYVYRHACVGEGHKRPSRIKDQRKVQTIDGIVGGKITIEIIFRFL